MSAPIIQRETKRPLVSEKDSTIEMLSIPTQRFNAKLLPNINSVADEIDLVRNLLDVLPEDKDYNYFDGTPGEFSPGQRMAYGIALSAYQNLPADPELLFRLGHLLMKLGDYDKSLSCFLGLSEKKPDDGIVWNEIAWCQLKLGMFEQALKSSKKALNLSPNIPNLYDTFAAILSCMGKAEEAISVIEKAMANIDHDSFDLNYQLAMLCEKKGDIKKAEMYWRNYLTIVKNQYGHQKAIRRVLDRLSRYGSNESAPDFIKENRESLLSGMMLAHLLCLNTFSEFSKAEKPSLNEMKNQVGLFIETICESYREVVDAVLPRATRNERMILAKHLNLISLGCLLQLKLDNIEKWLKKALSLSEKDPETEALLYAYYTIKVFQGVNENDEYSLLKAALKLNPKPFHAHILLARHYCSKKKFRKIDRIWKDVRKSESRNKFSPQEREMLEEAKFGVSLWRGVAKLIQGKDSMAFDILTDLHKNRPEVLELRYWLTIVYLRKGNITKAREMFLTIPSGVLPDNIYSQIQSVLEPVRISRFDSDVLFSNLRSPRMTGCSSSPIVSR